MATLTVVYHSNGATSIKWKGTSRDENYLNNLATNDSANSSTSFNETTSYTNGLLNGDNSNYLVLTKDNYIFTGYWSVGEPNGDIKISQSFGGTGKQLAEAMGVSIASNPTVHLYADWSLSGWSQGSDWTWSWDIENSTFNNNQTIMQYKNNTSYYQIIEDCFIHIGTGTGTYTKNNGDTVTGPGNPFKIAQIIYDGKNILKDTNGVIISNTVTESSQKYTGVKYKKFEFSSPITVAPGATITLDFDFEKIDGKSAMIVLRKRSDDTTFGGHGIIASGIVKVATSANTFANTQAYVYTNGEWKLTLPQVYSNSKWNIASP